MESRIPWTYTSIAWRSCYCCLLVRPAPHSHLLCSPALPSPPTTLLSTLNYHAHTSCPPSHSPALPSPPALFSAEPPGRRRELLHTEVPLRAGAGVVGGASSSLSPSFHLGFLQVPLAHFQIWVSEFRLGVGISLRVPSGLGLGDLGPGSRKSVG